jgi:MFS family permease
MLAGMRQALRARLSASTTALRRVFANRDLRRLELAAAGSIVGNWSYVVALAVFAFESGGAAAVGLVALIRFIPAALASPFASTLGDRFPRARVMLVSDLIRAAVMVAAALAIRGDASPAVVYALAAVASVVGTAFRPAQAALLPTLARSPEELTAANVAASTIESVGVFLGPALGGLLLAATGPDVVFAANAATFLWSALLIARIRAPAAEPPPETPGERRPGFLRGSFAGFGAIAREPRLRIVVLLTSAQTLVFGALTVLMVVLAFDLLDTGSAGVGFLNSAIGVGGLLGSAVAFALIGRRRLGTSFGIGIALWGLPIALAALWLDPLVVLALFAVIGAANTVVDVSGLTLMQRTAADHVLARVFGVLEGLLVATVGLGALAAPALVSLLGARGALAVAGALLPALTVLSWRSLAALDAPPTAERELELLRANPIFAPLPPTTQEELARRLAPVRLAAGDVVLREGEPGDRFYLVAEGEVEAAASLLGPGESFGEIALLRDVPRTATVTARTETLLYALERDDFLAAVTGHAPSAAAADAVAAARLGLIPARRTVTIAR